MEIEKTEKKTKLPKPRYPQPNFYLNDDDWNEANTCCGVREIGGQPDGGSLTPYYYEDDEEDLMPCGCEACMKADDYCRTRPHRDKKIETPWEIKLKKWVQMEEESKEYFGILVVYVLQSQMSGDLGRMVKERKFEYLGKFWNPKTKNTIHHYQKILHKQAPRRKKSTKRSFGG